MQHTRLLAVIDKMIGKDKIEDFLKKGGFLFELECIKTFENNGFEIQPALHYAEEESNLFREVDFIAYKNVYFKNENFSFNVSLVVECKSHMSPIIGTSTNSLLQKKYVASNLIGSKNTANLRKKIELSGGLDSFVFGLEKDEIIAQNIIEYSTNDKKTKDRVFESMMQSKKACDYLKKSSDSSDARFANIYIPVVIFDNQIFLASKNDTELEIEETTRIKASKFYAFSDQPYNVFHIISNSGLDDYCKVAGKEIDDFLKSHDKDIKEIIKTNPVNSGKGKYSIR